MAVIKRYKIPIETRLNQLWYQGYTVFERWELLAWFDKERLTNVVWREIQETWIDLFELEEKKNLLQVVKCDKTAPQTFVVIQKNRVEEMSELV